MSGKKSCEVAAVLSQGEHARRAANGIYESQLEKDISAILKDAKEMSAIQGRVDAVRTDVDDAASRMFGAEVDTIARSMTRLAKEIKGARAGSDAAKAGQTEVAAVRAELKSIDAKAAQIRSAIASKSHYCDEEFRQAREVLKQYESQRSRLQKILERTSAASAVQKQTLNNVRAKLSQLQSLGKQLEQMNLAAKNREQADGMRCQLNDLSTGIPVDQANKFMKAEYETVMADVSALVREDDACVLRKFAAVYGKAADFAKKLEERVALWTQQKHDAEDSVQRIEDLMGITLYEPIDYAAHGEEGEKTRLLDYLAAYGNTDQRAKYDALRRDAQAKMAQEDFLAVSEMMKSAEVLLNELRDQGIKLQESMLKKVELTVAIQGVMEELRYDVRSELITDNPDDGFRLLCSVGDEIIDFEKISISDDGNVIIDVDHHESRTGTCGAEWKTIMQKMHAMGVPMTDVQKNGVSILYQQTPAKKQETRGERVQGR